MSDYSIANPQKVNSTVMNKPPLTRFIVLTRSRTGSNMLMSLLNSHSNISAHREIFQRLNGRDYKSVLSSFFGDADPFVKVKGFKIFYYHPMDDPKSRIWDALTSDRDVKVIHLKRENILHTLISRKLAQNSDVWYAKEQQRVEAPASICFTLDELRKGFVQTIRWQINGDKMFRKNHLLVVYYEDLIRDRLGELEKILDFLGAEKTVLNTDLVKQNTWSCREIVSNYDELKYAFEGSEYEKYFEE